MKPPTVAAFAAGVASAAPAPAGSIEDPVTIEWAARQFVEVNREETRFVYEAKRWFVFDGSVWRPDETLEVHRRVKALYQRFRIEGASRNDVKLEKFGLSLNRERLTSTLFLAQSDASISGRYSDFDQRDRCEFLLNVANGTIDLRTGILRPHDRSDFISKLSLIHFDPDATCPRFERFLEEIFGGDEDLIAYFWRVLGYALTASVREHCFWIFYGAGANGKSTLILAIAALLGDYATSTAIETFTRVKWERSANENTPALARLRGARFVSAVEPKETATIDESVVKAIVGGDAIVACRKYENPFEFEPEAKIFIAVNNRPRIKDASEGMWRRVRLIGFPTRFDGDRRDAEIARKLKSELPGILAAAVRGCLQWQRIGLADPPSVIAATTEYRTEEDTLGRFLGEETASGGRVLSSDLFARYEAWCKDEGEESLKPKGFGQALSRRGLKRTKTHGQVFREGIHLV
jgi:putative DNA primase/helicase